MSAVVASASAKPVRTFEKLHLHSGQYEVFDVYSRFKVVVAGRRWGKTQLAKIAIINAAKVKKRKIWYVAPSYRMAKQIMWQDLLDALPRKWIRKINETTMTIMLVNGTSISLKGADKPDSLRGVGLHYLVMDEFQDMRLDTWVKVLRPTLAQTGGHALFIGTPKSFNHLYEVYSLGQRPDFRDQGQWWSWQFPTSTSPFVPRKEIEQARADMDEKSFRQEFEASFETMSGRVYHCFDRFSHVGDYSFNPELPIWVGQDFNLDPMASVILQPQRNGEVWAVDEIVLPGSNTEHSTNELERRYWRFQDKITVYPDPNSSTAQHARGESDLDIFREKGFKKLKYRRRTPRIADRVNSVNRMLKSADGTIRFRADRKCSNLIESLEQTIYKKGTREIDKTMNVEHITDGLGYCLQIEFPVRNIQIAGVSI